LGPASPATAIVVRRAGPFIIGVVLGLNTLRFCSKSAFLPTMRRAALAENIEFSDGGECDAAVGLRLRCADVVDERRLSAEPILRASEEGQRPDSEELEPPGDVFSGDAFSTTCRDVDVLRMALLPISRRGDVLSDESEA
jgi:hypothetical protein